MIRSKKHVRRSDAEKCLMCCPFDFNRYGDIMVNVMLVILCFFLTSVNLWWIFFWFLISMLFIYAWDHYRFLRQCSETHFNSQRMDNASQYLAALPCALLAGALAFKQFGGQALAGRTWKRHEDLIKGAVWGTVGMAFLLHLVLHILFVRFVVTRIVPLP